MNDLNGILKREREWQAVKAAPSASPESKRWAQHQLDEIAKEKKAHAKELNEMARLDNVVTSAIQKAAPAIGESVERERLSTEIYRDPATGLPNFTKKPAPTPRTPAAPETLEAVLRGLDALRKIGIDDKRAAELLNEPGPHAEAEKIRAILQSGGKS